MKLFKNLKFKIKNSRKGVSLPLVTGLVALLMVSSAAANEMVIRSMQSIQRIEASNRAYLAAEAGIEDALYELGPHFAGYQTSPLEGVGYDKDSVRRNIFDNSGNSCNAGDGGDWCNEWAIESRSGLNTWNGKLFEKQKLVIHLYNDTNSSNETLNAINGGPFSDTNIIALNNLGNFTIKFKVPSGVVTSGKLKIDNDQDGKLDEDPVGPPATPTCLVNPEDHDCDGLVNEDSNKEPVILWKLTDGGSKRLIPIKGCIGPPNIGSQPCEDDFATTVPLTFNNYTPDPNDYRDKGVNELGGIESINDFISRAISDNIYSKIQLEFLIITPMEHVQGTTRVEIPYFEYEVTSSASTNVPYPYFTIKSDGYYRQFKQSITATVTPKTTVPLFDFTIIQQE